MKRLKRFKIEEFNYINAVFLAALFLFLAAGLVRSLVAPNDILEYENRKANKMARLTFESFLSGEFQDKFEEAISDQIFGANSIKETYNLAKSTFIQSRVKKVSKADVLPDEGDSREILIDDNSDVGGSELDKDAQSSVEVKTETGSSIVSDPNKDSGTVVVQPAEKGTATSGKYYSVGSGLYMFNDWVVQGLASFSANQSRFDRYIARYNELIETYPDIDFYLYYIERDSDQNYATGSRAGIGEYLRQIVDIPESHVGIEEVRSFEEYKELNFKSDHHWNYKGSYQGYTDILEMIKPEAEPLLPVAKLKVGYTRGSFTKTEATATVTDDLVVYEFNFPKMDYYLNGKKSDDYGHQASCIAAAKNGQNNKNVSYANFYGGDVGEISIYNGEGEGDLLIFGNSYDNAVIKLLASHFEHTYCVDLRYFTSGTGATFSFASFLETHPVTDVICIGNAYYFLQSPFIIPK